MSTRLTTCMSVNIVELLKGCMTHEYGKTKLQYVFCILREWTFTAVYKVSHAFAFACEQCFKFHSFLPYSYESFVMLMSVERI